MHYILTDNALTVYNDKRPLTMLASDPRWDQAIDLLRAGDWDQLVLAMQPAKAVAKYMSASNGKAELKNNILYFNGQPLPKDWPIVQRILKMATAQLPIAPLMAFLTKVMANPSFRAVRSLIEFVEYGRLPLTDDGDFLAYKKVGPNYKDLHTGQFDNSVGQVLEMPRNMVDENPDRTCSSGLHVCSYDYLDGFGGDMSEGYRVVVCKINPADVVAVPNDYNNTKMRVCRYEVIDELEEEANLLADKLVWNDSDDDDDAEWVIEHNAADLYYSGDGEWVNDVDRGAITFGSEAEADEYIGEHNLDGFSTSI